METKEKRLMSIGEVARALGITRRILLNYEEKGLVAADVKDGITGNRYYTADTLTKIRTIRVLQKLGLSLEDIRAYYDGTTDLSSMIAHLEQLRDELNLNIEKLKERVKSKTNFDLKTVFLPAQTVFSRTLTAATVEERKEHLRDLIPSALRRYPSDTSRRMYFIEYPLTEPEQITYCIAVSPDSHGEEVRILPPEQALSVFYHGSYESIPSVRDNMIAYAKEHGIPLKGFCRHVYLEGPPAHTNPDKFITQVILPIQTENKA